MIYSADLAKVDMHNRKFKNSVQFIFENIY